MPGLVGITGAERAQARVVVSRMQNFLAYDASRHKDRIFCDEHLCATRAHSNILQQQPQPYSKERIHVWLDGEFYNFKELSKIASQSNGTPVNAAEVLLTFYQRHDDFDFLKNIDGIYSAVIYDQARGKVLLISDRYGLRHLFWTSANGEFAWSSEVKAMLAVPNFKPKIDPVSLDNFLRVGNLLGDRTWFDGVELLSAGTVLIWNLNERSLDKYRYWSPDEIKQLSGRTDEVELAEELGRLFRSSVERRTIQGGRVGLTLSGGLDSRAILAAMPDTEKPIQVLTFGKEGCEDSKIASIAAAQKGAKHRTVEITAANWLTPRVEAVWKTDGELDLMHMHVLSIITAVKKHFDISLDGCGANGIIGDGWMGLQMSGAAEYIDTRTRRFLILGPTVVRSHIEERFPFFDNNFLELALAAPEDYKKNNRIYRMMLLKTFPSFFRNIPWQRTGSPIKWPNRREGFEKRILTKKNRVLDVLSACGLLSRTNRGYADYANWVRQEPARTIFQDMLGNPSALYTQFISRERVMSCLAGHFGGRDHSEYLGRILTLEIWLQQVFESRFRSN